VSGGRKCRSPPLWGANSSALPNHIAGSEAPVRGGRMIEGKGMNEEGMKGSIEGRKLRENPPPRNKFLVTDWGMSKALKCACVSVERIQFQHSAQLMKSLTEAGVLYESVVYTDVRLQSLRHLYASITEFLHDSCWYQPQQQQPAEQTDTDEWS